jgi:hypothetical protein
MFSEHNLQFYAKRGLIMKPGKEDPQVKPLAYEDMHKLDDQQLESVQGGVSSPSNVLDEVSTSRDSSGTWITNKTTSSSIHSTTQEESTPRGSSPTSSSSSTEATSHYRPLPEWVPGAMPNKRRRIR